MSNEMIFIPPNYWGAPVATSGALPTGSNVRVGEARVVKSDYSIWTYNGSSWIASPSSPVGSALSQYGIWVGDSGGAAVEVDTSAVGDVQVDETGGAVIKAGAIDDANINAAAAIAVSKLAALTADRAVQTSGTGFLEPSSVTSTELGYVSGVTSSIQTQLNAKAGLATRTLHVGGGKEYATIADARTAAIALTPTAAAPVVIYIHPGTYTENVTGYDYVNFVGVDPLAVLIVGKVDLSGTTSAIERLQIVYTSTGSGDVALKLGSSLAIQVGVVLTLGGNHNVTGIECSNGSAGDFYGLLDCGVAITDAVTTTASITGINCVGAGKHVVTDTSVDITCTATTNGNHTGLLVSGGSELASKGVRIYMDHSGATYTGSACFRKVTTASPSPYIAMGTFCKGRGAGSGGTLVAFCMDTSGGAGVVNENNASYNASGYTNIYAHETAAGDTQAIRLATINRAVNGSPSEAGYTLMTPYDNLQTGFKAWDSGTANRYTLSTTTNTNDTFTLDAAGIGYIRSTPRSWAAAQSVVLTANACNYLYIDEDGTLRSTTDVNSDHNGNHVYDENVVLFEAWHTTNGAAGPDTLVVREEHPYKFDTAVSSEWHEVFGSVLSGTGVVISTLNAASRTIQSVGAGTLYDHGIRSTIADSTGVAVPWNVVYTTAGGQAGLHAKAQTALPRFYNNAGTPTEETSAFVVYRLAVSKDDLEGNQRWFAVMHTATFANQAAAEAAIASDSIAAFPTEISRLEVCRVGFVIIRGSTNAIVSTLSNKQVAISSTLAGGAANTANLVTTNTSGFGVILSAVDTTVQAALDTIDDTAAKKASSSTDNAIARFDGTTGQLLQNSSATVDDTGRVTAVGFATSTTTDTIRIGPDSDGSYRLAIDSGNLVVQKKIASVWTTVSTIGE